MNVFITRIIPESGLRLLEEAGLQVKQWSQKRKMTREELIAECSGADALLSAGQQLDREFLEASSHLKVIALHSVGYDNVDIETATRLKIPVGNTPGVLSGATADTAFLLMMAAARNAFHMHRTIINGEWGFFEPTANLGKELNGCTLGVFGLGKIGTEMAKRCAGAFGMKIIYHNRSRNEEAENLLDATYVSFEDLLKQSDVLTVHTALTPQTEGKFDLGVFKQMKSGSIFINTARGPIHNEHDLIEALESKIIWGAGLDVTNPEPMQADNKLLMMPNVAVLPHIGSATEGTRNAMARLAAENIIAVLKGEKPPFLVNPEVYIGL
ncbi:lactate dehydrogenase-like 2-hydroxyacid dehydrogenase [Pedobacter cryoconitis]|uniref:Glyoxylate/hydroxypyruvate reductase B n=1 Tax=Pedobacter cryoconitis TaxID=188932 RepID=A0A7W8ZJ04_9SPHI|nr:D-glycerate dehydrogenase [Pedobacter cryoconitis]MBB5634934.1 lactate dehydrogenase-like 2-hydroxyacid dehydrogenase [Pedobacter cryoconitis]MBB6271933.1 lactate dehydrogenase-like 2-hydroxyacid dehydrogenase [Pedobacter cryoconitis]